MEKLLADPENAIACTQWGSHLAFMEVVSRTDGPLRKLLNKEYSRDQAFLGVLIRKYCIDIGDPNETEDEAVRLWNQNKRRLRRVIIGILKEASNARKSKREGQEAALIEVFTKKGFGNDPAVSLAAVVMNHVPIENWTKRILKSIEKAIRGEYLGRQMKIYTAVHDLARSGEIVALDLVNPVIHPPEYLVGPNQDVQSGASDHQVRDASAIDL